VHLTGCPVRWLAHAHLFTPAVVNPRARHAVRSLRAARRVPPLGNTPLIACQRAPLRLPRSLASPRAPFYLCRGQPPRSVLTPLASPRARFSYLISICWDRWNVRRLDAYAAEDQWLFWALVYPERTQAVRDACALDSLAARVTFSIGPTNVETVYDHDCNKACLIVLSNEP
jgi:hypothetical protein